MPRLDDVKPALLDALLGISGSSNRPTASDDPFESIVRAGLGLLADRRVAEAVFQALREAGLINPEVLASADPIEIEDVLKHASAKLPAKSLRPLQKFARWALDSGFDAETASTETLREAWRALKGVGPATADAWLLLGLGRATYPVDRTTYRVLVRHGWLDLSSEYDEARSVAEGLAPDDPETLSNLRAAFNQVGREFCKPTRPRCDRCPLRPFLPDSGPIEADES